MNNHNSISYVPKSSLRIKTLKEYGDIKEKRDQVDRDRPLAPK